MNLENIDKKALRKLYIDYTIETGKAPGTADTTAQKIFMLWTKLGKDSFWETVNTDDTALKATIKDYVQTYYPNQIPYLSGFLTSIRYFKEFLAYYEKELSSNTESIMQEQPVHQKLQKPESIGRGFRGSVLRLTNKMLEEEHQKVLADPGYGADYALIDSIFKRFPDNTDPELVALKIALIDMTNSTNIARQRKRIIVKELADIIVGIQDFDIRLQQGDPSIVPIIAKSNGEINLFSFASKYCTYHSVAVYGNDDYVIYDSVVRDSLPMYVPGLRKSTIDRWRSTYNYTAYKNCIDELLEANGIDIPFKRRKLDHYLWHTYRKAE